MFSSFSSFSLPFGVPRFLGGNPGQAVEVASVSIHDVDTQHDKRSRTLKHLLKLNHAKHSIVYHHLQFHNHMPHILGSAYLLGAESKHLNDIYEKEHKELEPWEDSPNEVSTHDWRDHLGDGRYQRAYVDFFEDQLVLYGYDWKKVVREYLFTGKEPLMNSLIAGLGHPLIHLGYAYELSSRELAMEALGIATTSYNFLHKYLDNPSFTHPSPSLTTNPLEILQRVSADSRFDNLFSHPGADNIEPLFQNHEALILEHWNSWSLPNPTKQFEASQKAAIALLVATSANKNFDFFLVHLLTTTHAIRILLPLLPAKFHLPLVRQWFLLTLAVYIAQLRPRIDPERIPSTTLNGKDWAWVDKQAVSSKWALDAHFVKALRAMKVASQTWGDDDGEGWYLKAAVRMGDEFDGWGGFGAVEAGGRRGSATGLTGHHHQ